MRLEPQIETLYQTLNRELDNFPAGTKFYSVRKLMDKFKCHRGVLDEVLERLEANQLIDRIPQVGIFSSVTRRRTRAKCSSPHRTGRANCFRNGAGKPLSIQIHMKGGN